MADRREYEKYFDYMSIIGLAILVVNLYYYAHPLLRSMGVTVDVIDQLFMKLREGGIFRTSLLTKFLAARFLSLGILSRGKRFDSAPASSTSFLSPLHCRMLFRQSREPQASSGHLAISA